MGKDEGDEAKSLSRGCQCPSPTRREAFGGEARKSTETTSLEAWAGRAGCAERCTAELGLCRVDSRTPVEGLGCRGTL